MKRSAALAVMVIVAAEVATAPVVSQELQCTSRVTEELVKGAANQALGPSAAERLQAWGTLGRQLIVNIEVIDVIDAGTTPLGPACTATMNVWREDTQETFRAVVQFIIRGGGITVTNVARQ